MLENNGLEVFLALVKAGLWEQDISLSKYINPDYDQVFLLAEERYRLRLCEADMKQDVVLPLHE